MFAPVYERNGMLVKKPRGGAPIWEIFVLLSPDITIPIQSTKGPQTTQTIVEWLQHEHPEWFPTRPLGLVDVVTGKQWSMNNLQPLVGKRTTYRLWNPLSWSKVVSASRSEGKNKTPLSWEEWIRVLIQQEQESYRRVCATRVHIFAPEDNSSVHSCKLSSSSSSDAYIVPPLHTSSSSSPTLVHTGNPVRPPRKYDADKYRRHGQYRNAPIPVEDPKHLLAMSSSEVIDSTGSFGNRTPSPLLVLDGWCNRMSAPHPLSASTELYATLCCYQTFCKSCLPLACPLCGTLPIETTRNLRLEQCLAHSSKTLLANDLHVFSHIRRNGDKKQQGNGKHTQNTKQRGQKRIQ